MTETCANCGRSIGNLEMPCVFHENIVCSECNEQLNRIRITTTSESATPYPTKIPITPWERIFIILASFLVLIIIAAVIAILKLPTHNQLLITQQHEILQYQNKLFALSKKEQLAEKSIAALHATLSRKTHQIKTIQDDNNKLLAQVANLHKKNMMVVNELMTLTNKVNTLKTALHTDVHKIIPLNAKQDMVKNTGVQKPSEIIGYCYTLNPLQTGLPDQHNSGRVGVSQVNIILETRLHGTLLTIAAGKTDINGHISFYNVRSGYYRLLVPAQYHGNGLISGTASSWLHLKPETTLHINVSSGVVR
ncbi:MAG: hypothetical protein M1472_05440 [Planctomycetes bacterium]|nr:hypothetical protein [Planctomycetota bacterium]